MNASGAKVAELRYKPWGENRYTSGTTPTNYHYTGQREDSYINLYWYSSRWYDPYITHFTQPDSIIPDPYNALDWNRYSYARYNPLRYTDPTGHKACEFICDGDYVDWVHAQTGLDSDTWNPTLQKQRADKIDRFLTGVAEVVISIVSEPVDWGLTARDCLSGDCSPLSLLGLLPLIPSSIGKYGDEVASEIPTSVIKFTGETPSTIRGKVAHLLYPLFLGSDFDFRVRLPSGIKPDAVDWENHVVRELKPDNARSIQRGWNQIRKYISELFEMTGDIWTGYVDVYK